MAKKVKSLAYNHKNWSRSFAISPRRWRRQTF